MASSHRYAHVHWPPLSLNHSGSGSGATEETISKVRVEKIRAKGGWMRNNGRMDEKEWGGGGEGGGG